MTAPAGVGVVVALFALSAGVTAAIVAGLAGVLAHPVLQRENYRGRVVPTAAGLCAISAVIAVLAGYAVAAHAGAGRPATPLVLVATAAAGFGFLGLLDDLLGDGGDRGFGGHLRALRRGRVTTGLLKLAGGAALGLVLAAAGPATTVAGLLADGALIALAANLANLLDRAPGRTAKWALLAYVPLAVAAGTQAPGEALAVLAGTVAALLPGDVRERFMLGDTGANAIGAGLGVGAVLILDRPARLGVVAALAGLTLLSEWVSFSRIIAAVWPLRVLDRAGRLPEVSR